MRLHGIAEKQRAMILAGGELADEYRQGTCSGQRRSNPVINVWLWVVECLCIVSHSCQRVSEMSSSICTHYHVNRQRGGVGVRQACARPICMLLPVPYSAKGSVLFLSPALSSLIIHTKTYAESSYRKPL